MQGFYSDCPCFWSVKNCAKNLKITYQIGSKLTFFLGTGPAPFTTPHPLETYGTSSPPTYAIGWVKYEHF